MDTPPLPGSPPSGRARGRHGRGRRHRPGRGARTNLSPVSEAAERVGSTLGATVVVPTFRRPASLQRTLEALIAQRHPGVDWDVVVVDNDDAPEATEVVQALAPRMPIPIRCVQEPKRGACHARNRGISEVQAPITVFLDDDVIPADHDWLAHLLQPLLEHRCQGVAGRVLLDPHAPRPDWFNDSWDGGSLGQYDHGDEEQPVDPLDYIN